MRRAEVNEMLSSIWWITLLRGILALVLGLYAFLRPEWTMILIVQIIGIFLFIDGVLLIVGAITGHRGGSRLLSLLGGIFYIIAALVIFGNPIFSAYLTQTLIIYMAAFLCCATGITKIINSIRLWNIIEGKWWILADGIVSVVFAFVLFGAPIISSILLIKIAGFFAIIMAIGFIILTFSLRKMVKAT